jgi:hypothetical protein
MLGFSPYLALSACLYPSEIRADISAPLAACLAGEPRFNIGKPNVIRPSIGADRYRATALVIRTIDQDTANAAFAHLSEGDFLLAGEGGHGP